MKREAITEQDQMRGRISHRLDRLAGSAFDARGLLGSHNERLELKLRLTQLEAEIREVWLMVGEL